MSYTVSQVEELLQTGENERLEFKRVLRNYDQLATLMAAFANTNGGIIVVGVTDPSVIVGTNIRQLQRLFEHALASLTPQPIAQYNTVTVAGKDVALIHVERSPTLILARTGAYQRIGTQVVAMSALTITQTLQTRASTRVGSVALREADDTLRATGQMVEDPIARGLANLTTEVVYLKAQLAQSTGWQAQWESYLVGGVVGSIVSLVFTNSGGALIAITGVVAIILLRFMRSRKNNRDEHEP